MSEKTIPERIAEVMGTKICTVAEVLGILEGVLEVRSVDPRGYIATTLNAALLNLKDSDGRELKYPDGRLLKVHVFKAVARGRYRVATTVDMQQEAQQLLERARLAMLRLN